MNKGRKITGGKYHANRKKKFYEKQNQERPVTLRETKRKQLRTQGGNKKTILLNANEANVLDPKTKTTKKVKIKNVLETPQNFFLARQNRLIKSAIIETEIGKAKITNRPSQEGHINAVLTGE
ncbi:MAG: 30S ribosomal protein S8e [archaeon]